MWDQAAGHPWGAKEAQMDLCTHGNEGAQGFRDGIPLLGLDIGSVNVKGVLLGDGEGSSSMTWCLPVRGRPLEVVANILEEALLWGPQGQSFKLAVTGAGQMLICGPEAALPVNEVVAVAQAVARAHPRVRTIIDIGGQFTKWILLSPPSAGEPAGVADFALNGLCAAGSGAFLEQQAGRLRLDLDELGRLAANAPRGASIAGRCSVFAKSDMIHLQQRGTPVEEIAYGLCLALARTFAATVVKGRTLQPPVALVGGGAANRGLVRAFAEVLGLGRDGIFVPVDHLTVGARGAALGGVSAEPRPFHEVLGMIRSRLGGAPVSTSLGGRSGVVSLGGHSGAASLGGHSGAVSLGEVEAPTELPPLRAELVEVREALPEEPDLVALGLARGSVRAYLGVDVGSVSTNLVLLDEALRLVHGIYLPTRGAPVEVLDDALGTLRRLFLGRLEVLGVGTTGSGRYLAAQLLGADVVKNEITAQLVSAAHYVPEVDTIFEIGGQDSKYIDAQGGRLRDFEMNKICAAGTGSFLEEQAERLGVSIKGDFAKEALEAGHPRDLGTRCTVFMDAELVRAQAQGAPLGDLCAGLAYSVARNYLEKVVAGRRVGRKVVFQGGTASNQAVVAAFGELLGRPLVVHPYNRISGAIGMAILSAREKGRRGEASAFFGLEACREHRQRTFECKGCENLCTVSRVEAGGRVAHFGDVCEKYTSRDRLSPARGIAKAGQAGSVDLAEAGAAEMAAVRPEPFLEAASVEPIPGRAEPVAASTELPDLFAERSALLQAHLPSPRPGGRPRLGLVRSSLGFELLPLFAHLVDHLGFEPVISGATTAAHLALGASGLPPEVCLPLKLANGHVRQLLGEGGVERVLMPTILEFPSQQERDRPFSCLYAHELPDMAALLEPLRVLTPQLVLGGGAPGLLESAWELSRCLGVDVTDAEEALAYALERHRAFESARRARGRQILASPLPGERAVVVLGKPYNLHDAFTNLNLARHMRRLGLLAIPMDLLPTNEEPLSPGWFQIPWHFNREQARAIKLMASGLALFPLLVSNFGCGPDAFTTKHLERMLGDRPRLFLEFDEHRGEAGLITRLEAFVDEVDAYQEAGHGEPLRSRVIRNSPQRSFHRVRRVFLPCFEGHSHVFAGLLRSKGLEAVVLPPPDEETARFGEEVSSGRECHPYALITGELVRLVRSGVTRSTDVFFAPSTRLPCLLPQYGDGWRMVRDQLGAPLEIWDPHVGEMGELFGTHGLGCVYGGLTVIDYLIIAGCIRRPREVVPGSVDAAIARCYRDVQDTLARALSPGFRQVEELTRCVERSMERLRSVPLGPPVRRPLVGVTGDLYTRINSIGNGDLFRRLEAMGCIVWPAPFFGATADFEAPQNARRKAARGEVGDVMKQYALGVLQAGFADSLLSALHEDLRPFCEMPSSAELQGAAEQFFGPDTNHLVRGVAGMMVAFARRGVHGVISAAGINCMVGVSAAAAVPAIRAAHGDLPVVALFYGSKEGPSHRIGLETFVHQVYQRYRRQSRVV